MKWGDLLGVFFLAGIGFTVSLVVSELSFGLASPHYDHAKVIILLGSVLGAFWLVPRNKRHRVVAACDKIDADDDGIPDTLK